MIPLRAIDLSQLSDKALAAVQEGLIHALNTPSTPSLYEGDDQAFLEVSVEFARRAKERQEKPTPPGLKRDEQFDNLVDKVRNLGSEFNTLSSAPPLDAMRIHMADLLVALAEDVKWLSARELERRRG